MKISIQTSLYIEKCIFSFVNIWKYERDKDDTWTDWLLNNKCSRKLSKRTEWSPLTIITIGTLLSVAVFYASLFICYQGFIYYANTILPFHFPLSWYLLGVAILAICISSGMITIVKKYKNSSNKLGDFFIHCYHFLVRYIVFCGFLVSFLSFSLILTLARASQKVKL